MVNCHNHTGGGVVESDTVQKCCSGSETLNLPGSTESWYPLRNRARAGTNPSTISYTRPVHTLDNPDISSEYDLRYQLEISKIKPDTG